MNEMRWNGMYRTCELGQWSDVQAQGHVWRIVDGCYPDGAHDDLNDTQECKGDDDHRRIAGPASNGAPTRVAFD